MAKSCSLEEFRAAAKRLEEVDAITTLWHFDERNRSTGDRVISFEEANNLAEMLWAMGVNCTGCS